jgi:hypothetical protein
MSHVDGDVRIANAICAANHIVAVYTNRMAHRPDSRSWQYSTASNVGSYYVVPYWEWRRYMLLYALCAPPRRRHT